MRRKIIAFGHGDKRPGLGFPTEQDIEQWIKEDILTKQRARYHYFSFLPTERVGAA